MAIAFVAKTDGSTGGTNSTTLTYAHNHSSGNFLVVTVLGGSDHATGVTYNGVAMTKAGESNTNSFGVFGTMWYLANPASGSNNVIVTKPASTFIRSTALSYSGVNTDVPYDNFADNGGDFGSGYSQSVSVKTGINNCMAVLFSCSSFTNITGWGTGQTERTKINETSGGKSHGVSDEVITTSSSATQSFTASTDNFSFNLVLSLQPEGVIAVDSFEKSGSGSEVTSLTWSHTVNATADNIVLVVGISIANSSNSITGVTYNGTAMTKSATGTASLAPDQVTEIYYLANPSTGANDVVASFGASSNSFPSGASISFVNADVDTPEDTSGKQATSTASPTVTFTTNNNNSILVDKVYSNNTTVNVGALQTSRGTGLYNGRRGSFSTEPTTTAGSHTMSWSLGGSDRCSISAIAINESIPISGPATVKTVNGAATATVKTVNGTATASVKTINGAA